MHQYNGQPLTLAYTLAYTCNTVCHATAPICTYPHPQVPEMTVQPLNPTQEQCHQEPDLAAISLARFSRAQCLVYLLPTSSLCAELCEVSIPSTSEFSLLFFLHTAKQG